MSFEEDLQIDYFRVEGQGVNENSRGVRIIHKPTGITVTRTEKTFHENKDDAYEQMKLLLKEETSEG